MASDAADRTFLQLPAASFASVLDVEVAAPAAPAHLVSTGEASSNAPLLSGGLAASPGVVPSGGTTEPMSTKPAAGSWAGRVAAPALRDVRPALFNRTDKVAHRARSASTPVEKTFRKAASSVLDRIFPAVRVSTEGFIELGLLPHPAQAGERTDSSIGGPAALLEISALAGGVERNLVRSDRPEAKAQPEQRGNVQGEKGSIDHGVPLQASVNVGSNPSSAALPADTLASYARGAVPLSAMPRQSSGSAESIRPPQPIPAPSDHPAAPIGSAAVLSQRWGATAAAPLTSPVPQQPVKKTRTIDINAIGRSDSEATASGSSFGFKAKPGLATPSSADPADLTKSSPVVPRAQESDSVSEQTVPQGASASAGGAVAQSRVALPLRSPLDRQQRSSNAAVDRSSVPRRAAPAPRNQALPDRPLTAEDSPAVVADQPLDGAPLVPVDREPGNAMFLGLAHGSVVAKEAARPVRAPIQPRTNAAADKFSAAVREDVVRIDTVTPPVPPRVMRGALGETPAAHGGVPEAVDVAPRRVQVVPSAPKTTPEPDEEERHADVPTLVPLQAAPTQEEPATPTRPLASMPGDQSTQQSDGERAVTSTSNAPMVRKDGGTTALAGQLRGSVGLQPGPPLRTPSNSAPQATRRLFSNTPSPIQPSQVPRTSVPSSQSPEPRSPISISAKEGSSRPPLERDKPQPRVTQTAKDQARLPVSTMLPDEDSSVTRQIVPESTPRQRTIATELETTPDPGPPLGRQDTIISRGETAARSAGAPTNRLAAAPQLTHLAQIQLGWQTPMEPAQAQISQNAKHGVTDDVPADPMKAADGSAGAIAVAATMAAPKPAKTVGPDLPTTSADVAEQIGPSIVRIASAARDGTVSVRLHPAELGIVDLKVERAATGLISLTVTASHPESLKLLGAERHRLEDALTRAGIKPDAIDIVFQSARAEDRIGATPTAARHEHATGSIGAETLAASNAQDVPSSQANRAESSTSMAPSRSSPASLGGDVSNQGGNGHRHSAGREGRSYQTELPQGRSDTKSDAPQINTEGRGTQRSNSGIDVTA